MPTGNDIIEQQLIDFDVKKFKGKIAFEFPIVHQNFIKKILLFNELTIISIGNDNQIVFWDLENRKALNIFKKVHEDMKTAIIFKEKYLITASKQLKIFKIIVKNDKELELKELQVITKAHDLGILEIFPFHENSVMTVSQDNVAKLWIFNEQKQKFTLSSQFGEATFEESNKYATDVVMSADKSLLILIDIGRQINIFDIKSKAILNTIPTQKDMYENAIMLLKEDQENNNTIFVTGSWRDLTFWDLSIGDEITEIKKVHNDWIQQILKIDENLILTCSDDRECHIWRVIQKKSEGEQQKYAGTQKYDLQFVKTLEGNTYSILTSLVLPGNKIVTGSADSKIIVFE